MIIKILLSLAKPPAYLFWLIGIVMSTILCFSLSSICFDVSKKSEYTYLTKPIFETEADFFLFKWSDSGHYALAEAGMTFLPSSCVAYENDPENWMFSDGFAEARQKPGYFHTENVLGIIPKGTRLKIIKIKKNPLTGEDKGYFARLENDLFSKYLVDISWFLVPCTTDQVPEIRKGYLKPIDLM